MTLTEFLPIRSQNNREVTKLRHLIPERLIDHELPKGVAQMFFGPKHVCDFHEGIVDNTTEIIDRHSVGSENYKIPHHIRRKGHIVSNEIMKRIVFLFLNPKPGRPFFSGSQSPLRLF